MSDQNVIPLTLERSAFLGALGADAELAGTFGVARRNFSEAFETAAEKDESGEFKYTMGTEEYDRAVRKKKTGNILSDIFSTATDILTTAGGKSTPSSSGTTTVVVQEKKGFQWYHGVAIVGGVAVLLGGAYLLIRRD